MLRIPRSEFGRNVLTMLAGTAAAQAIPIVLSPALTRLYAPEEFGVFALYMVLVTLGTAAATARYELAILLPPTDEEAVVVARLALRVVLGVSLVGLLAALLFGPELANLLGVPGFARWLVLVPISVGCFATYQVFLTWQNRRRAYGTMARAAVAQQGVAGAANLTLGMTRLLPHGLVIGTLFGQATAAGILATLVRRREPLFARKLEPGALVAAAKEYRQFPLYNLPYSLLGAFSRDFVLLALTGFGHIAIAGFLQLSRRILYVPVTFLSGALDQVYFQEASVGLGTERFERLSLALFNGIARAATPGFVFVVLWCPVVFPWAFGREWEHAGIYASVFAPVAFCVLFTAWPDRLFVVTRQQRLALILQIIADGTSIATVASLLALGVRPLYAVAAFSAVYCTYHTAYLILMFRVAGFRLSGLRDLGLTVLGIGGVSTVLLVGLRVVVPWVAVQFALGAAVVAGVTLHQLRALQRQRQAMAAP